MCSSTYQPGFFNTISNYYKTQEDICETIQRKRDEMI